MSTFYYLLVIAVNAYIVILIVDTVISWLIAFNLLKTENRVITRIIKGLHLLTEPLEAPIRRTIPPLRGFDFSPVILIILFFVLSQFLSDFN